MYLFIYIKSKFGLFHRLSAYLWLDMVLDIFRFNYIHMSISWAQC